jgi:hypothetical protein
MFSVTINGSTGSVHNAKQMNVTNHFYPSNDSNDRSILSAPSFAALTGVLAHLYHEETSSRRIVTDAGLDGSSINFAGTAKDRWHNILSEFSKQNKLEQLIKIVLSKSEYGDNQNLQTACRECLNSLQK